jgi:hypothetical protein
MSVGNLFFIKRVGTKIKNVLHKRVVFTEENADYSTQQSEHFGSEY